jgi:molybdenum cofactor cytidylyltransferase
MLLSEGLRIEPGEVVALVGAGGKTSAMFRLAQELVGGGQRVVTTTTTRIFVTQMADAPHSLIASRVDLLADLPSALETYGHVLVVGDTDAVSNKAYGITPSLVESIAGLDCVDVVIVEADGARMRSFKAPAEHEPVIPGCTTLVVPMAGMDAVGRPLDEVTVHRPELVMALTGAERDQPITPRMVAAVVGHHRGGCQYVPRGARVICLLNKVDTEARLSAARQIAALLQLNPAVNGVAVAATGADEPGIETWGRTAAIVLAAGAASRFGEPKLLMDWDGTSVVGRVVDRALAATGVDEVVVVVGCDGERVAAALGDRSARVIRNEGWEEGQSSSVRAGLKAVENSAGAALFLLGDQPETDPLVIDKLIQRHRETLAPIVVPVYRGQRQNPVLFDRKAFPELGALRGDTGGRALFQRFSDALECVPIDAPPPFDIDTMGDYRRHLP